MNVALWLWRTARRLPETPALFHGTECQGTYADFGRQSACIAQGLKEMHGIKPGDRVALFLANDVDYLPTMFGIWAAGAIAVPVNAKLHEREASWILKDSEAKLCFVSKKTGQAIASLPDSEKPDANLVFIGSADYSGLCGGSALDSPVQRERDDIAWLFYTSGTTGRPKGVMLSNGNLQAMSYAYFTDVDQPLPGGVSIYAAPISHGAGLYCLLHVLAGSGHVVPESGGFDSAELLELGKHFGDVSMFAAPTMIKRLVDHVKAERVSAGEEAGQGLRTIVYGGGPMYLADIVEAVEVFGSRFIQIYGQGETPMTITRLTRERVADRSHPRWRERLASVGDAHSCAEVRIVDDSGKDAPTGETGEILVRGPMVMQGYWNRPEASAETLRDGWLWTGDIGCLDEDGYLTLKDRSKDVIISGGTNIYPREVEEVLLMHPDVLEVSVIGKPHLEWGEDIAAFVVIADQALVKEEDLDQYCLDNIARFKRPKHYYFVDELPKNNYGKVLKTVLRERL